MNDNNDNIYKPKATGPILAGIALVLVLAVIISVVCIIALSPADKGDEPQTSTTPTSSKDNTPPDSQTTTTNDDDNNDDPVTPPDNPGDDDPPGPKPPQAKEISVPTGNAYKGPLLLIDETNFYHVPESDLLSRTEMSKLSSNVLLSKYGFKNVYGTTNGNYKVKSSSGYYLNVDTLDAFNKMLSDYAESSGNKDVQLRNAYYYDKTEKPFCMNATGCCVDLEIYNSKGKYPLKHANYKATYYDWFIDNCAKYGFVHIGDSKYDNGEEKYSSFRYVGIAHASYMTDNSMSLETYLNTVKEHTFDNRLVLTGADGNEWWVYYAAGTGDTTTIKVIGDGYSISGNNYDGFVIAVNASALSS